MELITLDEAFEKWEKYKKDKLAWEELNKFNKRCKFMFGLMDFGMYCDFLDFAKGFKII